jgi:ABC-type dipeptide/oligopeptide/nickel transport system permease subunit
MATTTSTRIARITVDAKNERSLSFWQTSLRYLRRDRLTVAAMALLFLLTVTCFFAPPLVEQALGVTMDRTNVLERYRPVGTEGHPLGTDQLGRDQLVRLLYGGQVSLAIAYFASLLGITVGVMLGMMAGYFGGVIDDGLTWFINTLSSIPGIFLLILASVIWSPSPQLLIILLAFFSWITVCRLVRGEVLTAKERDYVIAARALGAPTWRILASHLLPNVLSLVIVALTIEAGTLILSESALSFLGVGVQEPSASWGNMLTASRQYFVTGVHLVVFPGLLITVTVLCFYIIGDGLRDAFDPRASRR